jgi:hypothetical protein
VLASLDEGGLMLPPLTAPVLAMLVLVSAGASAATYSGRWPGAVESSGMLAARSITGDDAPSALWILTPEEFRTETERLYVIDGRPGPSLLGARDPDGGEGGLTTYRYVPGDGTDAAELAPLVATRSGFAGFPLRAETPHAADTSYALVHASHSYALVTPIPAAVLLLAPALGGLGIIAWRQRRRDKAVA